MSRLIVIVAALAFVAPPTFADEQRWDFVQSVGGLKLEAPSKAAGVWLLPLVVDVSGLKAVTRKPSSLNSGIACEKSSAVVEGANIYVSIVTGIAGPGKSPSCPSAKLGALAAGKYRVFYRGPSENPVQVGVVSIGP